jgi:hypothetical protein
MLTEWLKIKDMILESSDIKELSEILIPLLKKEKLIGKYHPLGFYSFNLCKLSENENIRLHIWKNKSALQNSELLIHNHIFNFKSLVLLGKIKNYNYKIYKDLEKNGYLYEVNYSTNGSILKPLDKGYNLINESIQEIEQGNYYQLHYDKFHKSENDIDDICATLLYTNDVSQDKPMVFSPEFKGNEIYYNRIVVTLDDQNEILEELIKKINF